MWVVRVLPRLKADRSDNSDKKNQSYQQGDKKVEEVHTPHLAQAMPDRLFWTRSDACVNLCKSMIKRSCKDAAYQSKHDHNAAINLALI